MIQLCLFAFNFFGIAAASKVVVIKINHQVFTNQRINGFNLTRFFLSASLQRSSKEVELIAEEIVISGILSETNYGEFVTFLKLIHGAAIGRINDAILKQVYSESGLPRLTAIGAYVDLRSVLIRAFSPGEPIESYTPQFKGFLPLLIVNLKLEAEDEKQRVVFQMDRRTVELLIDSLRATLKDFDATLAAANATAQTEGGHSA